MSVRPLIMWPQTIAWMTDATLSRFTFDTPLLVDFTWVILLLCLLSFSGELPHFGRAGVVYDRQGSAVAALL